MPSTGAPRDVDASDAVDVKKWWAENPMTYGAMHGKDEYSDAAFQVIDKAFFERLDKEFCEWNASLHGYAPFSNIYPYREYVNRKVLEIGCGLGTMSMNWAKQGADIHALDLNPTSVTRTRKRFEVMGLNPAKAIQGDGRTLPFPDDSFDYVYSWGVLHHSPDLPGSLDEMMRVLKPGGGFGLMLYNRRSFLQWYQTDYLEGFLHWENRFLNPVELASRYGDGGREEGNPHTWPVTKDELREMLGPHTSAMNFELMGRDLEMTLDMMLLGIGRRLPTFLKKPWARRFGWSHWVTGNKKS